MSNMEIMEDLDKSTRLREDGEERHEGNSGLLL